MVSKDPAEAVNVTAEAYSEARQAIVEALNDPEAHPGSLSAAAQEAEAARAAYDLAVQEYEAEAEAGALCTDAQALGAMPRWTPPA